MKSLYKILCSGVAACLLALTAASSAVPAHAAPKANDAERTFKGKTVTLIIPLGTGGTVDLIGRYFTANLGKYLPGNPRIVARNVTPRIAGTNFVYKSKPDGLTIGISSSVLYQDQYDPSASFDVAKFRYVGATNTLEGAWFVRGDLPYNNVLEGKGGKTPIRMATMPTPSKMTGFDYGPLLLAEEFDLPLQLIPISSTETAKQYTMLERGEIDGMSRGIVYYHLANHRPGWVKDRFVKPFAFIALPETKMWPHREGGPILENVTNLIKKPEIKEAWDAVILPNLALWLPFYLPPGTPDYIVEAYRKAFDAALADPEFLKKYETLDGVEARPVKGADVQRRVEEFAAAFAKFQPRHDELVTRLFNKYTQRRAR